MKMDVENPLSFINDLLRIISYISVLGHLFNVSCIVEGRGCDADVKGVARECIRKVQETFDQTWPDAQSLSKVIHGHTIWIT